MLLELSEEHVDLVLDFVNLDGTFSNKVKALRSILGDNDAVKRIEDIFVHLNALGIQDAFNFNLKIVRGLDYYTGLVFEAEMLGVNMGSICSGGRYDNLLSLFSGSLQKVSGVGGSFGIDRIQDIIEIDKFNYIKLFVVKASSRVLIVNIDDTLQDYYYKLADKFRRHDYSKINNIACEVYPKSKDGKNIKIQIEYALAKAIRFLIFVGQEEYQEGKLKVRDLTKKEELLLSFDEAIKFIKGNDKFLCTPF
ncbi:Histidyl-tRNA synthetase [Borrelia duttonii CR2A]|uniref:histidine--tRNA ligase n=1 Tax=Borrelia duttonii CR2A TaxID=1432657 RepID=W6TI63_9SPIR|nr:Histidyl-tRNA synthetase [Borrelia duttonii CR2A]